MIYLVFHLSHLDSYNLKSLDVIFLIDFSHTVLRPNRTFLVRFGDISGVFGRAVVRILARSSRAKIPMARPNEPDMPPKRAKRYD